MSQTTVFLGATSSIAQACLHKGIKEGRHITLVGRNRSELEQISNDVGMPKYVVDCCDIQAVADTLADISQTRQVESVVCFVGSFMLKPAHLLSERDWNQTLHTNLTSAFAAVHGSTKVMLKTGGQIILLSSAVADIGLMNHEAISAAKAGVIGLAKATAASYAKNGIRVNCVAPGMVESKLSSRILANPQGKALSISAHPLGRVGKPQDVADVVNMLLHSEWITGEVIKVDGGLSQIKIVK